MKFKLPSLQLHRDNKREIAQNNSSDMERKNK